MILDYQKRDEFDTGRFVARYLQVFAWLSIVCMAIEIIFRDSLQIDFSCVFLFWAASALQRHSPIARKWVLAISVFGVVVVLAMLVFAATAGTAHLSISVFGKRVKNPALWQVAMVCAPIWLAAAVPFFVLISRRARRQFAAVAPPVLGESVASGGPS